MICLINARPLLAHPAANSNGLYTGLAVCTFCCRVFVWVRSFIEPDLFDNHVLFDNTTPIYLINLHLVMVNGIKDITVHCADCACMIAYLN